MSRPTTSLLSAGAVLALTAGATLAFGAAPASAAPNQVDGTFLVANEQTNLAEITIGTLALQKATTSEVRDLATMTVNDHKAAQTKVLAVAKALGVTLPTAPNSTQQAQAAQLQAASGSAFDVTYAQIQVAGHQLSLSDTDTELSGGSDPSVKSYATSYKPVVTMHLQMAQSAVTALGGTPGSVPAGTGGQAATTSGTTEGVAVGLVVVGGVALVGAGGFLVARRRRVTA
ncbi:DUF4142 domain-containing protein [Jatrophihabitans sp. YIM 134969]